MGRPLQQTTSRVCRVCNIEYKAKRWAINHPVDTGRYEGQPVEVRPNWNRKCTFCKKALHYPRYYYHEECGASNLIRDGELF